MLALSTPSRRAFSIVAAGSFPVRSSACQVARTAPPDHIEIELRNDGIEWHQWMIGEPAGAYESHLLSRVPHEKNGPLWSRSLGQLFRDLEKRY